MKSACIFACLLAGIVLLTFGLIRFLPKEPSPAFFKAAPKSVAHDSLQLNTTATTQADEAALRARISDQYGQLPMRFEANQRQNDPPVRFTARGNGYAVLLTPDEAVIGLHRARQARTSDDLSESSLAAVQDDSAVLRMKLAGAKRNPRVSGLDELSGRSNYFIGNDPSQWQRNVPAFARVKYESVWPGIDLVWYGNQQQLEHDFILAPGADPRQVRLQFTGTQDIRVDEAGALVLRAKDDELRFLKPVAWQNLNGQRQEIACEYQISPAHEVTFRLGEYDPQQPLVIDPVLLYSTFIGGLNTEQGLGVAVDKDGNAYITGETFSTDFPTVSPIQDKPAGTVSDAYVLKLNASGTDIVYATYLGGQNSDTAFSIAIDKNGNAFVAGTTLSTTDFPITTGVLQSTSRGLLEGFVAKLNPTGSALVYSTFLGGDNNDSVLNITTDDNSNAYVVGSTASTNLSATGIQTSKSGNAAYKSTDSAANWSAIRNGLNTTITQGLTIAPGNSNTIYAATVNGVFKSTDGGTQWQLTGQGTPISQISLQTVAVDPSNPMVVYAAGTVGVLRSTDGGNTYTIKNNGFSVPFISSLAIHPTTPTTLYASTISGAFKTINGGDLWTPVNTGLAPPFGGSPPNVRRIVIHPTTPNTLYAATNRGMYKTTDGGTMWTAINNGLGTSGTGLDITTLAIDPTAPDTLYAGVAGFAGALYKTTDGGATWVAANNGLTLSGSTAFLSVQALAINPASSSTIYAGTVAGVYKSTNGGTNWNPVNTGLNNLNVSALAVDPTTPANVYAGTNGGTDGFAAKINTTGSALVWLTYLGGFESDQASGIAVDKDGVAYVTGVTISTNFPTVSPLQAASGGGADVFLTKINASGTALLYSSYFGGNGADQARGLALGANGSIYVTGNTSSTNFPVLNPVRPALGGGTDAFVTRFNAAGSALEFSTWLGGTVNDQANGVAVDSNGNAYITGFTSSTNFPTQDVTQQQLGGGQDAFVTKLSNSGALVYSTWLGSVGNETGTAIAVDSVGNAYVVGTTSSQNFPTINPLHTLRGPNDAFITKIGVDADLTIAMTSSRNPVMVNNNLTYTLTVTNNGPSPATGVTVTNPLPGGVNFVSATASQGTCNHNAGTVTCNLGNLAKNAGATITLTATPTATATITNTATVTGSEPDSVSSNNQVSLMTTVSALPSIAGRVTETGNKAVPGVTMTLSGTQSGTAQTNTNGAYQLSGLALNGNYTITPSLDNYSFEPPSRSFNNLTADQTADFTATICSYALSTNSQTFGLSGGSGTINVTATARCPWVATSNANWITINSGASGSGNGAVSFTVAPTTVPRNGRITIAGLTFVIWQEGQTCTTPGFTARTHLVGFDPGKIEVADLNGDGNQDLAALQTEVSVLSINSSVRNLVILSGDGTGKFVRTSAISSFAFPSSRASALFTVNDFNGDQKPDIALFNDSNGRIEIYLNNGNGTFANVKEYSFSLAGVRLVPSEIYSADLNQDNRPDLLLPVSNNSSFLGGVVVMLNNGSGGFGSPIGINLSAQNVLGLADFTGDGKADLLTWRDNFQQATLSVYPADGFGSFTAPMTSPVTRVPQFATFNDFNGDGKLDVAMTVSEFNSSNNYVKSNVSILPGDGTGKFGAPLALDLTGQGSYVNTADFNGDAKPDVLLSDEGKASIALGDGTGKPASITRFTNDVQSEPRQPVVGDFNKDGKPDIAVLDFRNDSVVIYLSRCAASGGPVLYGRVTDRVVSVVGIRNVTVKLSGAATATTQTDESGNYEFTGLNAGSNYTVTVERGGFEFTPASQSVNNLTADRAVNFTSERKAVAVSAASYSSAVAPDSIAAIFGAELSPSTASATTVPLPFTLGSPVALNTLLTDSMGRQHSLGLFFVSPGQVNLLIPKQAALGTATISLSPNAPYSTSATARVQIESVVPSLFTANASGSGLPAAQVFRLKADGSQIYEPLAQYDPMQMKFNAVPIDLGPATDQVFLVLSGTGIRNRTDLSKVTAKIGGADAEVLFAGDQGSFVGVDQINVRIPRSLIGRGEVEVALTVENKAANPVKITIK